MNELLWFNGITWETTVDTIGWTYVLLVLLLIFLAFSVMKLVKDLNQQ